MSTPTQENKDEKTLNEVPLQTPSVLDVINNVVQAIQSSSDEKTQQALSSCRAGCINLIDEIIVYEVEKFVHLTDAEKLLIKQEVTMILSANCFAKFWNWIKSSFSSMFKCCCKKRINPPSSPVNQQ